MTKYPPEYQKKYLSLEKRKLELKIELLKVELSQVLGERKLLEYQGISSLKLQENSIRSPEGIKLSEDDLQILFLNLQRYINFYEDQDRNLVKILIGIQERLTLERILDLSPISEKKELIRRILLNSSISTN